MLSNEQVRLRIHEAHKEAVRRIRDRVEIKKREGRESVSRLLTVEGIILEAMDAMSDAILDKFADE